MTDSERIDWLEQETHKGFAPQLVYDDNGNWAVSYSGFAPMPVSDVFTEEVTLSIIVEPAEWRPTIREAIDIAYEAAQRSLR